MNEEIINLNHKILPGGVLTIEAPKLNPNDWLIKNEEALRPDKGEFVFQAFKKRFPNIKVKNSDQMYKLCSRSALLSQWLANVNLDYIDEVKIPAYALNLLDKNKVESCYKVIKEINSKEALKAKAIKTLSDKFKIDLEEINKNEIYKTTDNLTNEVKIIMLNTNDLPLTLQLAIENFTPKSKDSFPDNKAYAREMLFQYKKRLFSLINEKPEINIQDIIDQLKEK